MELMSCDSEACSPSSSSPLCSFPLSVVAVRFIFPVVWGISFSGCSRLSSPTPGGGRFWENEDKFQQHHSLHGVCVGLGAVSAPIVLAVR